MAATYVARDDRPLDLGLVALGWGGVGEDGLVLLECGCSRRGKDDGKALADEGLRRSSFEGPRFGS